MSDPPLYDYIREHEETLGLMRLAIPYLPPMSEARRQPEERVKEAERAGYEF